MKYTVAALINEGPGMFRKFDPKDKLAVGPRVVVEAADAYDALDEAWTVGNRMAKDADGLNWPSDVRSLSVGDVLIVIGGGGETGWAVSSFGFDPVNPWDALGAVIFGKVRDAD